MPRLPFLIDENVADSVGHVLTEAGHEVTLVRDSLGRRTPDQILAVVADRQGLIVVTHDKDLRRFSRLVPEGLRRHFRQGAGVIFLACPEPLAARRVREEMEAIEFHHERARRSRGRLHLRITKTSLTASLGAPAAGDNDEGIPDGEP